MIKLLIESLQTQGLNVIETEDRIQIATIASLQKKALLIDPDQKLPDKGVVSRIIQIHYLTAKSLKKDLEHMVSDGAGVGLKAFEESNNLLITDDVDNIRRVEELITYLDQPGADRNVKVVALKHAEAESLAQQLNALFKLDLTPEERIRRAVALKGRGIKDDLVQARIISSIRTNSLLILGTQQEIESVSKAIAQLDVETPIGKNRIQRIPLLYRDAESTATVLNNLLAKKLGKDAISSVAIEPDKITNSLVIDAPASETSVIEEAVKQSDIPRPQVLIRALIVEISTDNNQDIGFEFAAVDEPKAGRTLVVGRTKFDSPNDSLVDLAINQVFPKGLTIGVAKGTITDSEGNLIPNFGILAKALIENSTVNILAAPEVMAEDNRETEFNIVENIPVLQSTIQAGSGSARDVIQNIERVDVGIKLKLTPHINPNGLVRLELNPSIEAIISSTDGTENLTPTIAKREVKTAVTVKNKETFVLSGLIRENNIKLVRKIPLISDLPLLGHLFQRNIVQKQKTNLYIFICPEIIEDYSNANIKSPMDPTDYATSEPEKESAD